MIYLLYTHYTPNIFTFFSELLYEFVESMYKKDSWCKVA